MKKFLLFLIAAGMTMSAFSQHPANAHKRMDQKAPYVKTNFADQDVPGTKPGNVYVSNRAVLDDPILMVSRYDLQSNSSSGQQRIYRWPDGTMSGVETWSLQDATYSDRGTGYNYFDGTTWGPVPTVRQESVRTGWPEVQPLGASGECLVSHQSATTPLIFCKRATKGTGAWTESEIAAPSGAAGMLWPRMVTNGPDHNYVHIICLTSPVANGGTTYLGMDGALLYIQSLDGGTTWSAWQQLNGMTTAEYLNFTADIYAWAQPQGNTLAFTVGDSWQDQFLMKSLDNGATWTKTIIWPCPYNFWAGGDSVSRYYTPDATMAVALDQQGMAHVTFGLQQSSGDVAGLKYWVPYTDGLIYWNEYMPPFDVLDWQTLYDNGNMIGWVKDTNVFYPTDQLLAHYYASMTSNPGITIDEDNNIFVIWSGVTPLLDPDNYYLRHIYNRTAKKYPDNNVIWQDSLTDVTSDFLQYNWAECMYPDIAANSDDKIYILFQSDDLAGSYVKGVSITGYSGQTAVTDNNYICISPSKTDLYVGIGNKNNEIKTSFTVSKNYPNPVGDMTTVKINTQKPGNAILEVTNLMGQKLITMEKTNLSAGNYHYAIDCSHLASGVYFYTVKFNNESITNKMVVE